MSGTIVELRAGEGGEDARLLVHELLSIYVRMGTRRGL
jgi:protein subunit release factor A